MNSQIDMFDLMKLAIPMAILVLANVAVYRRTKLVLSPFFIMSITFFFPLFVATLRLSTLQSQSWSDDTIVLLWTSAICWGLVPFLIQMKISDRNYHSNDLSNRIELLPTYFIFIGRWLAGIFVLAFFAENYVLSGSFLPFLLGGSTLHEIHTKSLPVLGLLTKGNVAIVLILFITAVKSKSLIDRIAIPIIVFLPAMRGSRIDIVLALISLAVAYSALNIHIRKALLLRLLVLSIGVAVGGGYLAEYRTSQGRHEISLAKDAGLSIDQSNVLTPAISQLFANFVLPFENLDRLVRKNKNTLFFGELTLVSPILCAFFEADRFMDIAVATDVERQGFRDPTTPTGVGTALGPFYLDFGPLGAAIPMLFYMLIWLYFYRRSTRNVWVFLLYCLYSSFFSLTAFHSLMATPGAIRVMVVVLFPFILIKFLNRSNRPPSQRSFILAQKN